MAVIAGELAAWPSKEGMAASLRSDGLGVTVGRYSVRVEGKPHFTFQEYGGDLSDPVIDTDAESVADEIQQPLVDLKYYTDASLLSVRYTI